MHERGYTILFGTTIPYQLRYHQGLEWQLAQRGWNIHFASADGPELWDLGSKPRVTSHALPMSRKPSPLEDCRALLAWVRLLRRVRPDVVVLGTPKASLLGLMAAAVVRIPTRIYEVHGLRLEGETGLKHKILQWVERATCALATDIVPVSRSLRDALVGRRIARSSKLHRLGAGSPNGVDVMTFTEAQANHVQKRMTRERHKVDPAIPLILFVGRMNEDKGLTCLAKACELVARRHHVQLMIVGPVDDSTGESGLNRIRGSGVRVITTGEVNDVAPLYAIADVFCLPSKREGLPTVILEAFAASIPVVATAATGIIDLVAHEETGMLVAIDDHEALAEGMLRLIEDRALRETLVKNALHLVEAQFTRTDIQTKWVEWLESFVE